MQKPLTVWSWWWTGKPGILQSMGSQTVGHDKWHGTELNTIKGFNRVNKEAVDIFLKIFFFFYKPMDVGSLISGFSAFSKSCLNIWKFSIQVLFKPSLKDFEHYLASMWNKHNCAVVWTLFGIVFLWDWSENCPFPILRPQLSFPNFLAFPVQHFI